jgi:hypothetical protein
MSKVYYELEGNSTEIILQELTTISKKENGDLSQVKVIRTFFPSGDYDEEVIYSVLSLS